MEWTLFYEASAVFLLLPFASISVWNLSFTKIWNLVGNKLLFMISCLWMLFLILFCVEWSIKNKKIENERFSIYEYSLNIHDRPFTTKGLLIGGMCVPLVIFSRFVLVTNRVINTNVVSAGICFEYLFVLIL